MEIKKNTFSPINSMKLTKFLGFKKKLNILTTFFCL